MNKIFKKDVTEKEIKQRMKPVMHEIKKFLVHRSEIDIPEIKTKKLNKKKGKINKKAKFNLTYEQREYLKSILVYPNLSITARGRKLFGYSNDKNNRIKKSILSEKYATEFSVDLGPDFGGRVKFLKLTFKGYKALNKKQPKNISPKRGSLEHIWWQEHIFKDYNSRGFKAIIEYQLNGKAADIGIFKNGEIVAVEIELTPKNAIQNLKQNIDAGFLRTIIACKNTRTKKEIEKNIISFLEYNSGYENTYKLILLNEFPFIKSLFKEIRG